MENIMRAYGVPQDQLITLRGGEDYEFGKFSWKVIPSVHSALDHTHCFSSKTFPDSMKAPLTLEQMNVEGGTLAYLIRFDGHQVLAFGGMNYIDPGTGHNDLIVTAGSSYRERLHECDGHLQ